MKRLGMNTMACAMLSLVIAVNANDMKPMSFGPRRQNADGDVTVSYERDGKKDFSPGITLTIKGAERAGFPALHIKEALYFVDAKLDEKAKRISVVFVDGLSMVYQRYHVNAGVWEFDMGGALMEFDLKLQRSNRMELTDMNTLRCSFIKKGESFIKGGRVPGKEMPDDEVMSISIDQDGNVFRDGNKIQVLSRKRAAYKPEPATSPADGKPIMSVSLTRQERDERARKIVANLGRGRSAGSEEEIRDALAILKEGVPSPHDDDVALLVLHGMQRNLRGMRREEWNPSIVSNYYECVSHLKNVRLETETKRTWDRYADLKGMAVELNGGEQMLALVIRAQLLVELKQYADRVKKSNEGDAQEIRTFIGKEAKDILQGWPASELRKMIENLAMDR